MLLKSLKLCDFRQFKGEQDIYFSTEADKNVTVVMGENGSGKTTLAQAFTWCLYGQVDFEDKNVLSKAKEQEMGSNEEAKVKVEIQLSHAGRDYNVIREQLYKKDSRGLLKKPNQTIFKISYKGKDGQQEFIDSYETVIRMQEILPKELSRYFFFDGERIENMSKEIHRGKVQEFASAVRGLLGLSAFIEALKHLKMSIKRYENEYDSKSDSKVHQYTQNINSYKNELENIDKQIEADENSIFTAEDYIKEYENLIRENFESKKLAEQRDELRKKYNDYETSKKTDVKNLLDKFHKGGSMWTSGIMIQKALVALSQSNEIDKGVPNINKTTIEFLIKRGHCICGTPLKLENESYNNLIELLNYIPPQSIGNMITQFTRECELKCRGSLDVYKDISDKYKSIRECENTQEKTKEKLETINKSLAEMKDVGELQRKASYYRDEKTKADKEKNRLLVKKGNITFELERVENFRHELVLKDKNNRKIEQLKAYAKYMYKYLDGIYKDEEKEIRNSLEKVINEIFHKIYNGGFSLKIDEKYNIKVIVDDYQGYIDDVETSTAQSISIIFAFIAGVIKMARDNNANEDSMMISEAYPLVMDAPLSAFDKTRIQTVCEALPKVAEQVIIFIKDTDGEIAEKHMGSKVGAHYYFDKKNEFETYLKER
ncbi:chromosome partition protein Smc [Clostridium ragsdalei P11]|uniref:Nuclease SbcCD subunit C n=1 Tax=Clostridium ragsdalei P11 TaxID=1353534 RepID=A0A1A6AYN6_9CLOT|nr:AAA family ATPase [Clostridium ragsdalei]OBR95145.1 chromosome partition protein Smc [Clostridium ragsdalei P11]